MASQVWKDSCRSFSWFLLPLVDFYSMMSMASMDVVLLLQVVLLVILWAY